jgi:hypothetical protein
MTPLAAQLAFLVVELMTAARTPAPVFTGWLRRIGRMAGFGWGFVGHELTIYDLRLMIYDFRNAARRQS